MADARLDELRTRTVWRCFLDIAETHSQKQAFVAADDEGKIQRVTYGQLVERARNLSAGLASIGVRRGDHLAVWLTNTPEWIVTWFAAMRLGAPLVPVNTFLRPPEVQYVLDHAQARHLVMLDRFRKLDLPAALAGICPEFAGAERPGELFSPHMPWLRNVVVFNRSTQDRRSALDFAGLEEIGASSSQARELADRMELAVKPGDVGIVKYTSGSTGFPKGALLEQGGIVANSVLHSERVGFTSADTFFSMMPFFHAGGSIWGLMTTMIRGGTLVFTEAFNTDQAVSLLADENATVMIGVLGDEVIDEAAKWGKSYPALWSAAITGQNARKVAPNVRYAIVPFGLTETYGPAAVTGVDDPPERLRGTCGQLLPGNRCKVIDPETGLEVAPGEPGEAWLKGNVMRGYWRGDEQIANPFDEDGWFRSGDLVSMDADGYLTYIGRLKLMIKVGGENVSLEEVENAVRSHPDVVECGAVGVPDDRKDEAACVFVVPHDRSGLNEAGLREWLAPKMAHFKLPRDIVLVRELPWLANGKLDRVALNRWAGSQASQVPLWEEMNV